MNDMKEGPTIKQWLSGPMPHDVKQAMERLARADDVRHIAIMPDVHLSDEVCVGVAVATNRLIYPQAVGGDIGCGMAAIRFECDAEVLADERAAARLLAGLYRIIPTIRHSRMTAPKQLSDSLLKRTLCCPQLEKLKARDGRVQFATLGRGNHFLEFQADVEGNLWLMVHSGSRAMGQTVRDYHIAKAVMGSTELKFLDSETEAGQAYLVDLQWAIEYAEESRRAIVKAAADLVSNSFCVAADDASFFSCHHNHVKHETHFGEMLWVHRKGAISAATGEMGIIPGSMGTPSFHVEGRGQEGALCSSSHGAGRKISRREAFKIIGDKQLTREMNGVWFDHRLTPKLCDEAPSAYKEITAVMRSQHDLTKIIRMLRPILSYKGT